MFHYTFFQNSEGMEMPQNITKHIKEMVAEARSQINEVEPNEAISLIGDEGTVIVDIRDVRERQREGYIEGSVHVPRGMLEFWIDPDSPYHKTVFTEDKHFIFHCASGWRSALATKTAGDMGLKPVSHIKGGFTEWIKAGGPVTK